MILILCLCILATSKVMLQGGFAKKSVNTFMDAVCFNGIIFFFAAFVFAKDIFNGNFAVFLFGTVFGCLTVFFQLSYIKAMSYGNVSLTVLIVNLSMIIPVSVSVLAFDEQLTVTKVLGFLLIVITLFMSVDKKGKSENLKKWILPVMLAFLINGALSVLQQIFGKTVWQNEKSAFTAWSYIIATVLSLIMYLFMKLKGKNTTFKVKPRVLGIGMCIGAILGVFQFLYTGAVTTIDGLLLFPVYNGGTLILSSVAGVVLLKDKLTVKQIIGILTGIVGIVIINL